MFNHGVRKINVFEVVYCFVGNIQPYNFINFLTLQKTHTNFCNSKVDSL